MKILLIVTVLFITSCYKDIPKCNAGDSHVWGKWEEVRSYESIEANTVIEFKKTCSDCGWIILSRSYESRGGSK